LVGGDPGVPMATMVGAHGIEKASPASQVLLLAPREPRQ
jgi:hypothetical protein